MKKMITAFMMLTFMVSASAFAGNSDLFSEDFSKINAEMADLVSLDNYLEANSGLSYSDVMAMQIVSNLNLSANSSYGGAGLEPVAGIPSFLFGCVLGLVGVAIVYFAADDSEETKKALLGCVVGAVSYAVIWLIYFLVVVSAATAGL
jgi:hypothetical protein